ncbi:hypothetical protein K788_0002322 [Paraburkholderia caribensis MBA4]|uniref:Uncharacterized protein n=1 Tax=Paraburkholderia caribensis MBA4 TaxID=1323664 RepID=A0A0P0R921_9BURK|nr:hypothetical protein K788_0002322 [Paraburkholderia caribensis MBA4]
MFHTLSFPENAANSPTPSQRRTDIGFPFRRKVHSIGMGFS